MRGWGQVAYSREHKTQALIHRLIHRKGVCGGGGPEHYLYAHIQDMKKGDMRMTQNRTRLSKTALRQLFGFGTLVLILVALPFGIKFDSMVKPFVGKASSAPKEIVELSSLIQQATRSTYADNNLDTTKQLRYFIPAWEFAYQNDMQLTRLFPEILEGKLETGDQATWPGWAFYFQTKSKKGTDYCVADTRTLVVPDISYEQDQRSRKTGAEIEIVSMPGKCQTYIARYAQALNQTSE